MQGKLGGWSADLSTSLGHDRVELPSRENLNASLGPASPTSFYLGAQVFTQWTNNLDMTRGYDVGLAEPLQVSFGFEHRFEEWKLQAGEPDSYRDGGYVFPEGPDRGRINNRSAGVRGVSPEDAGEDKRNVLAVYGEVGADVTDAWYLGVALRHERYDDSAGDTTNGKITTRYEFSPALALRATASTGFRAPSLAQNVYQRSTVSSYVNTAEGFVRYFNKVLAPGTEISSQLGSKPLTPERQPILGGG